ncbi:MAG: hypothetical protein KDJ65_08810 [Anaerolineae bacterium]|nr:hypothetical protein [Anaerolineae bacterium]
MAKDIETTLRNIAANVASYVKDAAELRVETRYVEIKIGEDVATDFDQAQPAAQTIIKLDGDCQTTIPVRAGDEGLEIDDDLFDVHERNVAAAIEYRASMLKALLSALSSARE